MRIEFAAFAFTFTLAAFVVPSLILRFPAAGRTHAAIAVFNWLTLAVFIGLYAMQLGAVGTTL